MTSYIKISWPTGNQKYAKYGYYFTDHQALPLLLSIPDITRVLITGDKCENSVATIELSDYTAHFTSKLEHEMDKYCVGIKVKIFENGDNIFTGVIAEMPEIKNRRCTIIIDLFYMLENPINKQINRDEFQQVPEENEGKWGNILYGNGSAQTGKMFTAYRIADNKYLAAWNTLSTITGAYNQDENITTQITMTIEPQKGYTYILYTSTALEITFSANGPTESSILIENPARMLDALTSQFTGIFLTGIENTATRMDAIGNYTGNLLYIDDDITLKEILTQFCANFETSIAYKRDGNLEMQLLNWGSIETTAAPHPTLYKEFETWKDSTNTVKKIQRKYAYIPAETKYNREPQDITAQTNYNNHQIELPQRFLQNNQTSWYVSGRYIYIHQEREQIVTFQVPKETGNDPEIGDIILVSHKKTDYTEKIVQLQRESRNDKPFIKFEGIDITNLTGQEFALYEEGDPRNQYWTETSGPVIF